MRLWIMGLLLVLTGRSQYAGDLNLSHELEPGGRVLAVSDDGRYVVVNSILSALTVWDINEAQIIALFDGHSFAGGDEGRPGDMSVDSAVLLESGWLISIAGSPGLQVIEGLLAQNIHTGERQVLEGGNCDAVAVVSGGFVASCGQKLSHWQYAEEGFSMRHQSDYWLRDLIFDAERQTLSGLNLDPLSETGLVTLAFPSLESIGSLDRFFGRLLGMDATGKLLALSWTEDGDGVILERIDLSGMVTKVARPPVNAPRLSEFNLSPDGQFVVGSLAADETYQVLRLSDGELLADPTSVRFSHNLSLHWHPQGLLSWTQATTYYHDLLRLWQPGTSEIISNLNGYAVIYAAGDWQTLFPRDFEWFTRPFYHTDVEALVRGLFTNFETAEMLELDLELRDTATIATVTIPFYDDSVRAGRYELALRRLSLNYGDVWVLWEARERWQCARGELAGEWTTQFCP